MPPEDEILEDPCRIKYSAEIDDALRPHLELLGNLLTNPKSVNSSLIPAKAALEQAKRKLTDTWICQFVGNLTFTERSKIANWFETHVVKGDVSQRRKWMTSLAIVHAYTLLIAHKLAKNDTPDKRSTQLCEAWFVQANTYSKDNFIVDVDREAVMILEKEMFEYSKESGVAGNWQWGLDAGSHQEGWVPYIGLPAAWFPGDRDSESESEHSVSASR